MEKHHANLAKITKNITFILGEFQSRKMEKTKHKKKTSKKAQSCLFEWPNPKICPPLDSYLKSIVEIGEIEVEVLVYGFVLVTRILKRVESGTPIHLHKLLSVAIFSAMKMILDEDIWKISDFAEIAGLETNIMRELEEELLHKLNFKLHVSLKCYKHWFEVLHNKKKSIKG